MTETETFETMPDTAPNRSPPVTGSMATRAHFWIQASVIFVLLVGVGVGNWWAYHKFIDPKRQGNTHRNALAPILHLAETEKDLGDVALENGELLPVTFQYENRGQSALTIQEISTSCSCTDATASRMVAQPGESGEIHVQIRMSKLGPGSATVVVYTDDPINSKLELKCRWNGTARFLFDQTVVDFGQVLPGAMAERELKLTFQDQQRFPTCRIVTFDVSPEITVNPGTGAALNKPLLEESRYQVVLQAGRHLGPGRGVIRCLTQGCSKDEIVIPVSWTVRGRVQATPQQLFLDAGHAGDILKKKVVVTSTAPDLLVIQEVRISPEGVGTATAKRISDTCQNIEVQLLLTAEEQPLKGTLILECLKPVKETLEIPWTAIKLPTRNHK